MAAQHAPQCQARAGEQSAALERFHRVLRAGGRVAAGRRQRGREPALVAAQHRDEHALHLPPRSMTANPLATSATSTGNSAFITDFFGLMTTSAERCKFPRFMRTASRTRRRIRLRCTDPPSARLTVRPMRGPIIPAAFAALLPAALSGERSRKKKVMWGPNWRRPL